MSPATAAARTVLGYCRVSTGHQSLDAQTDALTAAGVNPKRIYSDKLTGMSTREQRPGLSRLLDYARDGDTITVVGIDRLGRNAAEVMGRPSENLASAASCCTACVRASTPAPPQAAWWPESWPAWPN